MDRLTQLILDLPEMNPLPTMLDAGSLPALVTGLAPIHRAHLVSAMHEKVEMPAFIVCADDTAAEQMAGSISTFLNIKVPVILSRELSLYATESVSRSAEQKRIAAFFALATGTCPICVCTMSALLLRSMPSDELVSCAFELKAQDSISMELVLQKLFDCGYTAATAVEGVGQFSHRGGILDFFSPNYDQPVRVEFWGDDIDTLGFFDVSSQRRIENISSCTVLPASEILSSTTDGGNLALIKKLKALHKKLQSKNINTEKLQAQITQDIERLENNIALPSADRYVSMIYKKASCVMDYIPYDAMVFLDQPAKIVEHGREYLRELQQDSESLVSVGALVPELCTFAVPAEDVWQKLAEFPIIMLDAFALSRLPIEPQSIISAKAKQITCYSGNGELVCDEAINYKNLKFSTIILASDERRAKLLQNILTDKGVSAYLDLQLSKIPERGQCAITIGGLAFGFEYESLRVAVLSDAQFVRRSDKKRRLSAAIPAEKKKKISSYADLSVGDYVVHELHGIGKFLGIQKMPIDGAMKDYVKIQYAGTDSLYVPATQLDYVNKYIGGGEEKIVKLSKMGGTDWKKTKSRAKTAAKEMAKELIALYAERRQKKGFAFSPDTTWQSEFEDSFGFVETDDQIRSVSEIKADMESDIPMDRLLCGDVGFGKTEVALRAVMKCVMDGKQAAILVPTTVLAQQHYQTAMQRFFGYPVKIDVLSRFRTPAQMKNTLRSLHDGGIDIIIGTHRLLQKDVIFKDLGLLIVDEEQRFGVSHKERLREMAKQVDTLLLSATPIPRTLNMAMSGIRDMSTLEEPPQNRQPVQTYVMEHSFDMVCDAIKREVLRGGQVFYLHNRTESIDSVAFKISRALPEVSVAVAHGKMSQEQLGAVMEDMVSGEVSVLVCTTIIETGIDIPNVNTLIIEDADKLGLAQLHQIRGRVGRSGRRANAYLTFRRGKVLSETAEKRLSTIREFAEFNSGVKIAMRDLEIRGAGNLLGTSQSGHMIDVGYDMYLKLLEEAVLEERGEPVPKRADCAADFAVSANIPEEYIRSSEQRMDIYRKIAVIRTEAEADDLIDEIIDRFGDPPSGVSALVQVALLRGEAGRAGIRDISQRQGNLRFVFEDFDMNKISKLYSQNKYKGRIKVEAGNIPCVSLRLKIKKYAVDEARAFIGDYVQA